MVKHIVLWTLHERAEGASGAQNAQKAKELLESLNGKIPGMLKLEVGIDLVGVESTADIALYSEFESEEALLEYQSHPEHLKLKPFMLAIRSGRNVIDYKV